jgi:hypothetical protein
MLQLFDFALGTELFKRQRVLIFILDLRKSWMHDISGERFEDFHSVHCIYPLSGWNINIVYLLRTIALDCHRDPGR